MNAGYEELVDVEEIGSRIAESIREYFGHPANQKIIQNLSFGCENGA